MKVTLKNLTLPVMASLVLIGCGGGGSGPTIIEDAHAKLIGTWIDGTVPNGCDSNAPYSQSSSKTILTFQQNDLTLEDKKYNNTTCDSIGLISDIVYTYSYAIEGTDKAKTGQTSFITSLTSTKVTIKKGTVTDPNILKTGNVSKEEFLFDGDHLVFSKNESTPTQYANDFNLSNYWIKMPK